MRIELSAVMSELLTILMELLTTLMELLAVLTILLTMFMNLSTLLPIFSTILLNLIHTEVGNYQQKCCDIFHIFRGGTPSDPNTPKNLMETSLVSDGLSSAL